MKGVSEIISAVLVVLISIALFSAAYTWGLPLIEKTQAQSILNRVRDGFDPDKSGSLQNVIYSINSNGGEQTFTAPTDGLWQLFPYDYPGPENNSIQFSFFSKATDVAAGVGWVPLKPKGSCVPTSGIVGEDISSIVCERADRVGDGFNITYRIWYRRLNGTVSDQIIHLEKVGLTSSTSKTIRISRGDIKEVDGPKPLTVTEIKILLA